MNMFSAATSKLDGILFDTMARGVARPHFLATTINTDLSFEDLGGGLIDLFLTLFQWGGVFIMIFSLASILEAHSNGDSGKQNKSVAGFFVGVIFFTLRFILQAIGILN